jgi:hypothetical protein
MLSLKLEEEMYQLLDYEKQSRSTHREIVKRTDGTRVSRVGDVVGDIVVRKLLPVTVVDPSTGLFGQERRILRDRVGKGF